jgi:LmbE family N-acetylglucosaminyl deacetylase
MSNEQAATPGVAMAIVAHPDDAEFGCAGTLAAWVREGWACHLVVCTDASGGGSDDATDVSPAARALITATRKAEQRAAAEVLGLSSVVFLDLPDGQIEPTLALRKQLVRQLRTYRPVRLICQSPERSWEPYVVPRYHPDHLAVATATMAAMYPASQNPWDFPDLLGVEGLKPHRVRELYVMGAPKMNHAVDISATLDIKLAALRKHDSQVGANFADIEKRIREWAAGNGQAHGLEAAEVFHRTEN